MSANLHPGVGTADVGRRLEMSGGGVDGDQVSWEALSGFHVVPRVCKLFRDVGTQCMEKPSQIVILCPHVPAMCAPLSGH